MTALRPEKEKRRVPRVFVCAYAPLNDSPPALNRRLKLGHLAAKDRSKKKNDNDDSSRSCQAGIIICQNRCEE
jgi:hypothetical protein